MGNIWTFNALVIMGIVTCHQFVCENLKLLTFLIGSDSLNLHSFFQEITLSPFYYLHIFFYYDLLLLIFSFNQFEQILIFTNWLLLLNRNSE